MQTCMEFEKLTNRLFQDIDTVASNQDEIYKFVLSPFKTEEERERLRSFLDSATQESISDAELQELWSSSSADIVFDNSADLRAMLRACRDRL